MACCGAQSGAFADSGRESHPASAEAARMPAVRWRASCRSIGFARFFVRSATTADPAGDGNWKPRAQVGEVGGEVFARSLPDPDPHPAHAHLVEMLEARHVLLAREVAVVEGARPPPPVTGPVQQEAGAPPCPNAGGPPAQAEQERDVLPARQ